MKFIHTYVEFVNLESFVNNNMPKQFNAYRDAFLAFLSGAFTLRLCINTNGLA